MNPDPKYVMVQPDRPGAMAFPVILPAFVEHSAAAAMGKPVSAGRCRITAAGVEAYGESVSLKLKPGPLDSKLLTTWFARHAVPALTVAHPSEEPCRH